MLHGIYIIDADNTLWDTHGVYLEAYRRMVQALQEAGYAFAEDFGSVYLSIRTADRTIARTLHDYEYDFTLLALALVHHAGGSEPEEAARRALSAPRAGREWRAASLAASRFYAYHDSTPPALFEHAGETLAALKHLGNVLILHSEGQPERVRQTLAVHGLTDFFHDLVLEYKSPASFARARAIGREFYRWIADIPPRDCVVVGDSPQRDILFGNLIGAHTIMKPGGFWGGDIPEDPLQQPEYLVTHLGEILSLKDRRRAG
ncbi:MAG: HAD family hydrolase [Thermoanaerobacterales bacterium]|nr:HAD family hydrolase [Bacillota bacterium]MDI6907439.1 HAD family hydrolase [Thermoanaerobacterales bacterium]